MIDKPTNFFNGGSSCVDLIFCNKPEFVIEYGIDHSLFHICHHNIIFAKINSKIALPPDYEREVWDYKKANIDSIQKSISLFSWERAFNDLSVSEKVNVLSSTLLNIFHNYIPNKIVKCSYKDPPWIMDVSRECSNLILNSKMSYIKNKINILNDKKTGPKVYWTILNYFLNNIKISSIPPIFANSKTISNVVDKAKCTPLENSSTLPPFSMKTDKRLNTINFNGDDIISIIKSLDSKKLMVLIIFPFLWSSYVVTL